MLIQNETVFGIAVNRQPCFVSAGPDRKFGTTEEVGDVPLDELAEAKRKARADNIYRRPNRASPLSGCRERSRL